MRIMIQGDSGERFFQHPELAMKTIQSKLNEENAFMPSKVSGDSMYANKADTSLLEKSLRFKKEKLKTKK